MTHGATSQQTNGDNEKYKRKPVGMTRPLITGDVLIISAVRAIKCNSVNRLPHSLVSTSICYWWQIVFYQQITPTRNTQNHIHSSHSSI